MLSRATTQAACEEFQARFPRHEAGICVYGDASGAHMQTTGTSDYQIDPGVLPARGLPQRDVQGAAREPGGEGAGGAGEREAVVGVRREALSSRPEVHGADQGPGAGELQAGQTVIDKEKDPRRTHLSDALGYLIWQECRPQDRAGRASAGLRAAACRAQRRAESQGDEEHEN